MLSLDTTCPRQILPLHLLVTVGFAGHYLNPCGVALASVYTYSPGVLLINFHAYSYESKLASSYAHLRGLVYAVCSCALCAYAGLTVFIVGAVCPTSATTCMWYCFN